MTLRLQESEADDRAGQRDERVLDLGEAVEPPPQAAELSDPTKRKVSYSVGGRSVSWTEYQHWLLEAITDLDKQIATADSAPGDGLGYHATAVP